jgi:type IV pilus assembly protein PilB
MTLIRKEIGDLLVDNGVISQEELDLVNREREKSGDSVTVVLYRLGLANESHLKNALELQYGVNYVSLHKREPESEITALIPEELARKHLVVPVSQQGDRLAVAMVDPSDSAAIDEIKSHLNGLQLKPMVCLEDDFEKFIALAYAKPEPEPAPEAKEETKEEPKEEAKVEDSPAPKEEPAKPEKADVSAASKEAEKSKNGTEPGESIELELLDDSIPEAALAESKPEHGLIKESPDSLTEDQLLSKAKEEAIVLLANQIIGGAIKRKCSNIHILGNDKQVMVHYRLNGTLFIDRKLPRALLLPLVTRYKMMAHMSVTERLLPQDGHIKVKSGTKELLCLVSIIPTEHGEAVSIWIV